MAEWAITWAGVAGAGDTPALRIIDEQTPQLKPPCPNNGKIAILGAAMHRVFLEQAIPEPGEALSIEGEEAVHALRVKRLREGDAVRLLDGAGVVAEARIDGVERVPRASRGGGSSVRLMVVSRSEEPRPEPWLEVLTATPKGARVDEMIDQLSQIGAGSWGPLRTERGIVDPRPAKLDRLERLAREAAKQSGRAWLMRIAPERTLGQALGDGGAENIVADASGEPYHAAGGAGARGGAVRLLVGPEGGWTSGELAAARAGGAVIARFGPHTMRIETAAVAGAAVIMAGATARG
ncbi:MAG: 16S rRNA (uracil(1498)-N(3))-methyltransferase [Phycisphaerales bacterium]|nr:16S rRNA (uracil(1498)-N(3))-methyltransferase [Phycisphaerales bacterium]